MKSALTLKASMGGSFFIVVTVPSLSVFHSCRDHLLLDKDVERSIEAAPDPAQIPPFDKVGWKLGIERAQAGSEHAAIGLGEQNRHSSAEAGQAITVRLRNLVNQSFALEPTEIVGRRPTTVGRLQQRPHSFHQLPVGKTGNQIAESHQSPRHRHRSLLAKT
jgi:hypothetical protein